MSFPITRISFKNSRNYYQTSFYIIDSSFFRGKSVSTSSTSPSASETFTKTENARPMSELPGFSPLSILKRFLQSKVTKKPFSFDSKNALNFFRDLKVIYGPIFKIKPFDEPDIVAITNPEDIAKLYRITMNEPVRVGFQSLRKIREEAVDNFFEKKSGILIENYEEWHRVRSKLQTPMMRPKNILRYLEHMDNVSRDFTNRIADLQAKHGEMPKNFLQELYKWSLESIGTVALNRRLGCLDPNISPDSTQVKIIDTVNDLFKLLNVTDLEFPWWKYIPSPSFKKLREKHDILLSIVYSHIVEAEKELEKKLSVDKSSTEELTLLETLLQTEGLTRKDVVTFILDMFFAGIDTTSHTIGFTLYLLARNKDKQKKLQEELDSVLGDGKETLTVEKLAKLSYLKACIKETLRLYPLIVGSNRTLTEDAVLGGYKIPKGNTVLAANGITAIDEENFKQSKEFIPERWMRDRPLGKIHSYASLPFSHGTRMCIGRRIAEQEMYTFLARVMHRFNVDYKYNDIDVVIRLVAMPSEPLRFEFAERKQINKNLKVDQPFFNMADY